MDQKENTGFNHITQESSIFSETWRGSNYNEQKYFDFILDKESNSNFFSLNAINVLYQKFDEILLKIKAKNRGEYELLPYHNNIKLKEKVENKVTQFYYENISLTSDPDHLGYLNNVKEYQPITHKNSLFYAYRLIINFHNKGNNKDSFIACQRFLKLFRLFLPVVKVEEGYEFGIISSDIKKSVYGQVFQDSDSSYINFIFHIREKLCKKDIFTEVQNMNARLIKGNKPAINIESTIQE